MSAFIGTNRAVAPSLIERIYFKILINLTIKISLDNFIQIRRRQPQLAIPSSFSFILTVYMHVSLSLPGKDQVVSFLWQHFLLLLSLYVMTLGVSLCVRSDLGSSVISAAPYAFSLAGQQELVPALSLGNYTNILNALFVVGQILVLRRDFQPIQLLQLVIGVVFGALIDLNMALTSGIACSSFAAKCAVAVIGSTVMAIGVAFEICLLYTSDAADEL